MSTYKTLVEALQANARDDVGIGFLYNTENEDFLSYAELLKEAGNCLATYQSIGVNTGDEMLLLCKSPRAFVTSFWACLLGGIIAIPLSFPENKDETHKVFKVWDILKKPWITTDDEKLLTKLESFSQEITKDTSVLEAMTAVLINPEQVVSGEQEPHYPEIHSEDTAFIQFSSGSTGNPKGILLTHENLLYNTKDIIECNGINESDTFLSWKPITHDFGMIGFHLAPIVAGVQQYRIPTNTFVWNPVFWLSAVNKYRATVLGSPNFGFRHFLKRFKPSTAQNENWDLSCVKTILNGAEPISTALCQEFIEELEKWGLPPLSLKPGYGLAESTLIVSICRPSEGIQSYSIDRRQLETGQPVRFVDSLDPEAVEFVDCGPPCTHTEVRITDEHRRPLGEDTIGRIEVKGKCVTTGYYLNPEATREVLSEDGWLDTQDLGFLHQGRLVIVGRIKEMIIIGGVNYFPHDIEQAILRVSGKDKLNQYIACSVPNADSGTEDLVIFVYYKKKPEQFYPIIEMVRQQLLDDLGLNVAHVLPVKKIPKTTSGKVQRHKLVQDFLNGEFDENIKRFSQANVEDTIQKSVPNSVDNTIQSSVPNSVDLHKEATFITVVREELEKLLGHRAVDLDTGLADLGLNSVKLMMLQERLEKRLGVQLSSTAVLDYPSIRALASHLSKQETNRTPNTSENQESVESGAIAVVGMACRLPGGVDSPESFWHLLSEGIDPVQEIPEWRWKKDKQSQADVATRMGGFLDNIDQFDPLFFGISPAEAETLDPQHRLLLELSWEAFEDAGWNPKSLRNSKTGVFVGIAGSDYLQVGRDLECETGAYTFTGTMLNSAAGRISYVFGLQGPSMAIDTACSSSLVAVQHSMLQLRAKKCDVALVAGVNLILRAEGHVSFSKFQALASSGRCRSFDENADGYIRSEGGVVLVLKRLEDAQKDGDHIWGIVRGAAVNHNGSSGGLTVPSGPAQQQVIRDALADAGLSPDDIDYLEAHGSGTRLGDPQEMNALVDVFGGRSRTLDVGSVKSNLGHLETAAGLTGLCKVLLAMRYGQIPANLHFNRGNPLIPWEKIPLKVVDRIKDWKSRDGVRRAGISSFGISGTNAHVVVEAVASERESSEVLPSQSSNLLVLSARTELALQQYVNNLAEWCRTPTAGITELCRTLSLGRAPLKRRLALTADNLETLALRLENLAKSQKAIGQDTPDQLGPLVFLFTGQGSQYHNMASELYHQAQVFKEKFDELDQAFKPQIGASLVDLVYGQDDATLQRPLYAQPLIFSIEIALAYYWESLGIIPDILVGHSIGEYAAACMAGVMSLQDAVYMVTARAKIMDATPPQGRMVGVLADETRVRELIEGYKDVSIAAINAPENITISGGKASIDDVVQRARKARIFIEELEVSHPFHSVLMRDGARELESKLAKLKFGAPTRRLVSTSTGTFVTDAKPMDATYWGNHLEYPVLFSKAIETVVSAGGNVFIEIGATATLSGLVAQNIKTDETVVLPSLRKNRPAWSQMHESIGQLWQAGYSINWQALYTGKASRIEHLPHTPYERQRVWYSEPKDTRSQVLESAVAEEFTHPEWALREIAATSEPLSSPLSSGEGDLSEIREELRGMISQVTGVATEDISDSFNLFSLGLDSLMLVQLGKNVLNRFEVDIPIKTFFAELHTVAALADYISKNQPAINHSCSIQVAENINSQTLAVAEKTNSPALAVVERQYSSVTQGGETNPQSNQVQQIINRQLDIMEEQLRLMNGIRHEGNAKTSEIKQPEPQQKKKPASKPATLDVSSSREIKLTKENLTPQQQKFLDGFIERWTTRTKKSKEYAAQHRDGLADWITTLNFSGSIKELVYPLVSVESKGSKFKDLDGNEYIDTAIGYGVSFFGHRPDFIVEALQEQLNKGFEIGPQSNLVGEVTTLIRQLTGVERVAYCNTGTEAVMVALRLARAVSGRDKIARFTNSFHGSFDGVLAEADGEHSQPMAIGIPQAMVDDTVVLRYGSMESLEAIRKHGAELAAVLVEPVQSRNPGLQPREYLHQLRALCSEFNIALIFDEMVTGFRIDPGGAQAYFGVEADLVTYGKLVGGGMPIGIVAGKARYLDAVDGGTWSYGDDSGPGAETTFFAGTFCKHPLTMAACKAVLTRLSENGSALIEDVNERTRQFVERANAYFVEAQVPLSTVQFGSMYRFVSGVSTDMSSLSLELNLFFRLMMEAGIYVWERRTCFFSTAHTDEDAEKILSALRHSVETLRDAGFKFRAVEGPNDPQDPNDQNKITKSNNDRFGLSSEERRVYIMSNLEGGNEAYQVLGMLVLDGVPNIDELKSAFKLIAENHEMLRSSFHVEGSAVVHQISEAIEPEFIQADLREGDSFEDFENLWKRPFDLTKAPLWRWGVWVDHDGCYRLVFNFHHIIVDGASMDVILQDLERVVNGAAIYKPTSTYRNFVTLEKEFLAGPEAAQQRDWWLKRLTPLPPALNLPSDGMRPEINKFQGASRFFTLDSKILSEVRVLARKSETTPFMVFLAAWSVFLGRVAAQSDYCIGIPWNRRLNNDFDSVVGMFAQTLVLRIQQGSSQSFVEFLGQVKEMCLGAYGHAEYPLDKLLEDLNVPRNLGRNPLFDVMFIYENGQHRSLNLKGVFAEPDEVQTRHATFDLTLEMIERADQLFCSLNYAVPLFKESRIDEWIIRFKNLLNEIIHDPFQSLEEFSLLRKDEELDLLRLGSGPVIDQEGMTASKVMREAFKTYAASPAVRFQHTEWSFSELDARVNVLAAKLHSLGVGKEDIVGILLPRSPEILVAMLAVHKVGAAWLPLDIAAPEDSLRYMLELCDARLLLSESTFSKRLKFSGPTLDPTEVVEHETEYAMEDQSCPEDLAYVIFTSGSTGRPKGVQIEQHSLVNFINGTAKALDWIPESRTASLTTVSFDIFLLETYLTLAQGGCVVLADESEVLDPKAIAQLVQDGQVDNLQMTPTRLQGLFTDQEATEAVLGSIKRLIVGGEAFPQQLLPMLKRFNNLRIFNVYGPTETCIWSTYKELTEAHQVSIGLPIDNTQVFVLDAYRRLVPKGVEGDLWIAGTGVARGYINQPDLTADRFVENPFGKGKMYRTGDRARWNDTELECLGRDDDQVKLRGYRIELGEIEEVLKEHPAIVMAVSTIQELGSGNKVLAAYYQTKPDMVIAEDEVRAWMTERLPGYMVPAFLSELSTIPQTPSGKVNRKALPTAMLKENKNMTDEPVGQLDSILLEIWKKFIGDRPIGIHDSFFDMGGNSFSLVLMQAELEKIFPGVVSVADLFANPTIIQLRTYIQSATSKSLAENKGLLSLDPSWFAVSAGEKGRVTVSLSTEKVQPLRVLAESNKLSLSEIIMSLLALYLNKEANKDQIPIWLLRDAERAALIDFDFKGRSDFGEVLQHLSSSLPLPDDFRLIRSLGPGSTKESEVRVGFTIGRGLDMHRLLNYLDFVLITEDFEEKLQLTIEYNRRFEESTLKYHLNRLIKMLSIVVSKTKVKGDPHE